MDVERSFSNQSVLTDHAEGLHPRVVIQDARFQLGCFPNLMCSTSTKLSAIRVMMALLDYAPNKEGQLYIAEAIIAAARMEHNTVELANLAQAWLNGLLFPRVWHLIPSFCTTESSCAQLKPWLWLVAWLIHPRFGPLPSMRRPF